jgi:hypothetical protein
VLEDGKRLGLSLLFEVGWRWEDKMPDADARGRIDSKNRWNQRRVARLV